jgi:heme-degrading monooxygenase HmoA
LATLIEFFDVPPGRDDAFLADWRQERDAGTLFRALRDDVSARFVAVTSDIGGYEVVHEDGDVDGAGGVTLIEPFDVPPGDDARFLADWHRLRTLLGTQRGYLGSRLLYAAGADLSFVAIGRWSSPLMRHRALQRPDVQTAAGSLRSLPGLYEVILSGP